MFNIKVFEETRLKISRFFPAHQLLTRPFVDANRTTPYYKHTRNIAHTLLTTNRQDSQMYSHSRASVAVILTQTQ